MCQSIDKTFVETIRMESGELFNLRYHEERMNRTRRHFFGDNIEPISLHSILRPANISGCVKYRVLYDENILDVEFAPYNMRMVRSLRPIISDTIDYSFKCVDRGAINELLSLRGDSDDIIIVRNGKLTDTSICNMALSDGKDWLTPASPLLRGTMRESLLDSGVIKEKDIYLSDITIDTPIRLFNAMIPFGRIECYIDMNY